MAITASALEGIKDNGLRWRYQVRVGDLSNRLCREDDLKVGDVAAIRDEYVKRVRAFMGVSKLSQADKDAIELVLSDLEDVDDDIDAVRYCLDALYDCFDYMRICAV